MRKSPEIQALWKDIDEKWWKIIAPISSPTQDGLQSSDPFLG